ncbi:MAG: hypothetical protein ABI891_00645 [Acidobacteriota bacterium]
MIRKFTFVLLLIFCFSFSAFSQSVIIKPKKITYKRPKPIQDFKKSFVLIRPQVKAATPAISRKIEAAISYEKNNDFDLKGEMGEFQWLEEASYEVKYNKNSLLDIILMSEGLAAYPSAIIKEIVIDTKTGNRLTAAEVFINLKNLAEKIRNSQKLEIKKAIAKTKKDEPDFENPEELFADANFTIKNLDDFSVSDKGITFLYDYAFVHAIQALQPEGRFFYRWTELKPLIKSSGTLNKFIRR